MGGSTRNSRSRPVSRTVPRRAEQRSSRQGSKPLYCSSRRKITQGREMNRKTRMASALILATTLPISLPSVAFATSPLLSGYGAPGAGEQAILGSTLVGGPRGGGGSGGSPRSGGPSSAGQLGANVAPSGTAYGSSSHAAGSTPRRSSASSGSSPSAKSPQRRDKASQVARHPTDQTSTHPNAYVYSNSLSQASASSPALQLSGSDILLLLGTVAALGLIAALTTRLAGLQG
jgi:hypothetical protein